MKEVKVKRHCGVCKKEFDTAKELGEHLKVCKGVKYCLKMIDKEKRKCEEDEKV